MKEDLFQALESAAQEYSQKEKTRIENKPPVKKPSCSSVDYSKVFTKDEMMSFENRVASAIESESYKEKYIRSPETIRAEEWQLFIKRNIPEGASHRGRMTGIFYKHDEGSLSADFWGDSSGGWEKSGLFNTTLDDEKYYIKL